MTLQPRYHKADFFKKFWQYGTGYDMIKWTGPEVSLKNFDQYSGLYYEKDDAGDAAAKELFTGQPFETTMKQLHVLVSSEVKPEDDISPHLKQLLLHVQNIPDWVNIEMLDAASALCQRSGLNALIVLRDFTLMGGYDYAYLNKPLIFTGALKKGAVKRLRDTLNFWVSVTRPGVLKPYAGGYKFCIITRMIHSYSRLMIIDKVPQWKHEEWGTPINTWDMIATYIGFSLTFLLGLKKLNVKISREEEDSVFHLWKYIGYLIGIPQQYIPNNAREATEHFYLWSSIQPCADDDSVQLAKALLDENLISPVFDEMSKRKQLKYIHTCCARYLLDRDVNERLKIPEVRAAGIFPGFLKIRNKIFYQLTSSNKQISIGDKAQRDVLKLYLQKVKDYA